MHFIIKILNNFIIKKLNKQPFNNNINQEKIDDNMIDNNINQEKIDDNMIDNNINQEKTDDNMNIDILKKYLPNNVYNELPYIIEKFNINTKLRLSHFLSQCSHESANFKYVKENLNYSSNGLLNVFSKYFNDQNVNEYARKPEKIANKVYANRMGNGDEYSGDGWKYRGRGYIQLTGKNNYIKFDKFLNENIIENPDIVSDKYPLTSAAWFFYINNLLFICDKGKDVNVIKELTKKINGGYNGLNDRIKYFNKFSEILNI